MDLRTDPRVARTRTLLQDALLFLARQKDLDAISVADITEQATVNRSTFYQHYADKETLLADALDAQAAHGGADLSELDASVGGDRPPEVLVRYCEHLAENRALYRKALGEHGSTIAIARLRMRISTIVAAGIEQHGPETKNPGLPLEIIAASITGSLIGVVTAWLDLEPMPSPEQAASWVWQIVAGPHEAKAATD